MGLQTLIRLFFLLRVAYAFVISDGSPPRLMQVVRAPRLADRAFITIESVATTGTGCPPDTVSTSISPDRTILTLGFSAFQTYAGLGPSDAVRNCDIRLSLHYPPGYTCSVVEATYHGFAQLSSGVAVQFETEYRFWTPLGATAANDVALESVKTESEIVGGGVWEDGDVFTQTEEVEDNRQVKSACNKDGETVDLLISIIIRMVGDGEGSVADEDATFGFKEDVGLNWEECE